MKRNSGYQFIIGFVLGAVMFGGSMAFAAGIIAQPKTAAVVINGKEADINGYLIEGAHYFQLRDLAAALKAGGKDFSIVWDSQGNRIVIDTSRGYDQFESLPAPAIPVPADTTAPAIVAPTEAPTEASKMSIDEMRLDIVRLTNVERAKAGLPGLEILPGLMDTAQAKAQDLLDSHYFDHVSPVYGTPGEMIKAAVPQAKSCGENLASWAKTPQEAFNGLLGSPAHKATMLDAKYSHIGVGVIEGANGGYWWVQQFCTL
jgi:uncharacterized protein YkwD